MLGQHWRKVSVKRHVRVDCIACALICPTLAIGISRSLAKRHTACTLRAAQREIDRGIGKWMAYRPLVILIDPPQNVGFTHAVTMLARGEHDAQFEWDSPTVENSTRPSTKEVDRLNAALIALGSMGNRNGRLTRVRTGKKRKPLSAVARKKIAAAQRARWAKWKAARRSK